MFRGERRISADAGVRFVPRTPLQSLPPSHLDHWRSMTGLSFFSLKRESAPVRKKLSSLPFRRSKASGFKAHC
jgi:hypothetical protein